MFPSVHVHAALRLGHLRAAAALLRAGAAVNAEDGAGRTAVDVAAERARLAKEVARIEAEQVKVEQKLANPNFTQKVPPAVLAEHQQRLADWQAKRAQTQAALAALG